MLDTNADFQGASADGVDARKEKDVPVHVPRLAQQNIVDRGRHDPPFWRETARVVESRVFSQFVQHLEQQIKSDVAGKRFIDHHEAALQGRVGREGKRQVSRSLDRACHWVSPKPSILHRDPGSLTH